MPVGTLTRSHCLGIRDTTPSPLPSFYFIVFFFWGGGGGWVGRSFAAKKTSVGGYFNLVLYVINLFLKLSCLQSVHIKDAASYACEREKWTRFIRILRKDFVPSK